MHNHPAHIQFTPCNQSSSTSSHAIQSSNQSRGATNQSRSRQVMHSHNNSHIQSHKHTHAVIYRLCAPRYGKAQPTESKEASRLPGCLWVPPSARYLQATFPPVTLDEIIIAVSQSSHTRMQSIPCRWHRLGSTVTARSSIRRIICTEESNLKARNISARVPNQ